MTCSSKKRQKNQRSRAAIKQNKRRGQLPALAKRHFTRQIKVKNDRFSRVVSAEGGPFPAYAIFELPHASGDGSGSFLDIQVTQIAFQHLASRIARQSLDKFNAARHFEFSQILHAMPDNGIGFQRLARL